MSSPPSPADSATGDTARPRERFELHLRLQASLTEWYRAMERALGGRVDWTLPPSLPATASEASPDQRYDLAAFDALIDSLRPA